MNDLLVISPILVPLITVIACLLPGLSRRASDTVSLFSAFVLVAACVGLLVQVASHGTLTLRAGSWAPPFGIVLVADTLSVLMLAISSIVALAVLIYGVRGGEEDSSPGHLHVLIHGLMLGVNGSFLTGDLFNLYVWFEVMLISSFILMVREGKRSQLPGGLSYVLLNLLASALFLSGAGLIYGKLGTLNLADMASKLGALEDPDLVNTSGALIFVAFAAKAALFPFHFWLPASYHRAAPAISALFAGLLTKVGVYALLRLFTLVFTPDNGFSSTLILYFSMATMVIGVLGAVAQYHIRRLLAFHIISQIGYMTAGLALGGELALAAVIFYVIHHIAVKSTLFLVGGVLEARTGTADIRQHGGFYKSSPLLALCFLIPAFSLGGIPPLSGFWAKLNLLQAGVETEHWLFIGTALVVGILTLFSMIKIWNESFWKAPPEGMEADRPLSGRPYPAMLLLCVLTLVFSLGGAFVFKLAKQAATELCDPSGYLNAVLKGGAL
ncbi:proton-conducting transporter membrane subunit [Haloferula rosea]|uniref:Na+/H+ antiporter subunit D n=1 Tax=Haloferula rosea TaxID=490093 RepID=A0A934RCI3_9BACT|nr:proton-conducting transporter membrane subunit [Haloferula rosea]MBK1826511.1 Na+/H+ antiporter subunit D [Haloferula rosea]